MWSGFLKLIDEYKVVIYTCVAMVLFVPESLLILRVIDNDNIVLSGLVHLSTIIASSVLASGIFTSITKTQFFNRVYQKALSDVLYGDNYLKKVSKNSPEYIREMWRRVSTALYQNKFPKISTTIQQHMLNAYSPAEHPFYYKNYRIVFTIKPDENLENYLDIIEEIQTEVLEIDENAQYDIYTSCYCYRGDEDKTVCDLEELRLETDSHTYLKTDLIDMEKDYKCSITPYNDEFNIKNVKITVRFPDRVTKCKIIRQLHRKVPFVSLNKIRINTFKRFVDGLFIIIYYDKQLYNLDFTTTGALEDCIDRNTSGGDSLVAMEYPGLILPKQGFLFFVDKKEGNL